MNESRHDFFHNYVNCHVLLFIVDSLSNCLGFVLKLMRMNDKLSVGKMFLCFSC